MIDPWAVTKYDRTYDELQEFLIFCRVVAGKNSSFAALKTNDLVIRTLVEASDGLHDHPFEYMQYLDDDRLMEALTAAKVGNYTVTFDFCRAVQGYSYAALQSISRRELCNIPGIGPKTASFFIAHSRKNARVAVLDRHILRWMFENHNYFDANGRMYTPPQRLPLYEEIERGFLRISDEYELTPAELDLQIWTELASKESAEFGRLIETERTG